MVLYSARWWYGGALTTFVGQVQGAQVLEVRAELENGKYALLKLEDERGGWTANPVVFSTNFQKDSSLEKQSVA